MIRVIFYFLNLFLSNNIHCRPYKALSKRVRFDDLHFEMFVFLKAMIIPAAISLMKLLCYIKV